MDAQAASNLRNPLLTDSDGNMSQDSDAELHGPHVPQPPDTAAQRHIFNYTGSGTQGRLINVFFCLGGSYRKELGESRVCREESTLGN